MSELPALPVTHYNAFSDGSEPLYTAENMHDYAMAAIEQAGRAAHAEVAQEPVKFLTDEQIIETGFKHFRKDANTSAETLAAFVECVRDCASIAAPAPQALQEPFGYFRNDGNEYYHSFVNWGTMDSSKWGPEWTALYDHPAPAPQESKGRTNAWVASLEKGIKLCEQKAHVGDADTLREVLQYVKQPIAAQARAAALEDVIEKLSTYREGLTNAQFSAIVRSLKSKQEGAT